MTPSLRQLRQPIELRNDLIGNGVLVLDGESYQFTQDYVFTAPSAASDLILGGSSNGRLVWKDAKDRTLKELQQVEAGR
ncbi:MAG TPA: DUF4357 domain-containing protein [Rhodoferax sp.]